MVEKIVDIRSGSVMDVAVFKLASGREVWQFVHNLRKDGGLNLRKRSYPLGVHVRVNGQALGSYARFNESREAAAQVRRNHIKRLQDELGLVEAELMRVYTGDNFLPQPGEKVLWAFNWKHGGFNQVWAENREGALAEVKRQFPGHPELTVDESTLRPIVSKAEQAAYFASIPNMD